MGKLSDRVDRETTDASNVTSDASSYLENPLHEPVDFSMSSINMEVNKYSIMIVRGASKRLLYDWCPGMSSKLAQDMNHFKLAVGPLNIQVVNALTSYIST